MACSAATTHAATFEASKVLMYPGSGTGQRTITMSMLGKTADGYQIWSCNSTEGDGKYTYWEIDGTTRLSRSVSSFSAGTKYKLVTDYEVTDSRETPVNSTYEFFTKVKSDSEAELYILDPADSSTFPADFCIVGNVTMAINDVGYNHDTSKYFQNIKWTVSGIDSKVFKEAVVEVSFDCGETWETVTTSTSMTGSFTYDLSYPQAAARFRVVAHPKDAYKMLANGGEWRSEESADIEYSDIHDFRDGTFGIYNAYSVIMNVGMSGSSTDIGLSLIGKTKDKNYQVWACHNTTGKYWAALWKIDAYETIRPTEYVSTFDNNKVYQLSYEGSSSDANRHVSDNSSHTHFVVVKRSGTGRYWADYFCWDRSAELSFASDYYLNGTVKMTVGNPTYSEVKSCNVQSVKWACYDVNANATGNVVIEASYDGGATWVTAATSDAAYIGCTEVAVPLTASKVRYRVAVYPKDDYRVLVENGRWVSAESTDFEQDVIGVPCSFSVGDIKTNFTDGTNVYDRSYSPEVSWNIPNSISDIVKGATLEYCVHDGFNEWVKAADLTTLSGSQKVAVPMGIDCLAFRIKPTVDSSAVAVSSDPSEVVLKTAGFEPAFTSFALDGSIDGDYDAATDKLNLKFIYQMNDDLYQTRQGSLVLSYSSDEGDTWTVISTDSSPAKSNGIQVSVPANSLKYMFRIGIASEVNNEATCGIESSTPVYDYTPQSVLVLNDTEVYTPMDVTDRVVKVTRSFEANKYETICLPFELTDDQIEDGFGAGTKVWEFTYGSGNFLFFNLVNSMEAGKPYIVKPGENKKYLLFDHIDINSGTTAMSRAIDDDASIFVFYFNGSFSPVTLASDGSEPCVNTDGTAYQPSGDALEMNGFRAHFKLPTDAGDSWWKILYRDQPSGIDNITVDDNQPVRVYNLRGQYIGNTLEGLPQGVYLVNDTKMVVKK